MGGEKIRDFLRGRGLGNIGDPSPVEASAAVKADLSQQAKALLGAAKSAPDATLQSAPGVLAALKSYLPWSDSSWGIIGPAYDSSHVIQSNISDAEQIAAASSGQSVRNSGTLAPSMANPQRVQDVSVAAETAGAAAQDPLVQFFLPGPAAAVQASGAGQAPEGTVSRSIQTSFEKQHSGIAACDPQFGNAASLFICDVVQKGRDFISNHWGKLLIVAGVVLFVAAGGGQVVGAAASRAKRNPKGKKRKKGKR